MSEFGFRRRLMQNALDAEHPMASLLRWPRWLVACATGKPTTVQFATGGLKMELVPKLHSFGSTSIYIKRDYYEPELLAVGRLISPGSVVLDIGGSFGIFALFMAHFVGAKGHVYSFEPGRFSFSQLTRNVAINDLGQRISIKQVAATDKPATLRLMHLGDSPVNFSVDAVGAVEGVEAEEVAAIRVDSVVPPEDAGRVSFIKIDVEGYEIAALEGARAIIEAAYPTIMFEVCEDALGRQGQKPADVYGFLASFGYKFYMLGSGHRFASVSGTPDGNIFASTRDLSQLAA